MNTKTAGYLILYGAFLIVMGLLGYLSNPEKAQTALMSGGTFGVLSIVWGVLGARGVRWTLPAAAVTTGLLALVLVWRASVGWLAVIDGKRDCHVAALHSAAPLTCTMICAAHPCTRRNTASGPRRDPRPCRRLP